jgi:hypothetical protein
VFTHAQLALTLILGVGISGSATAGPLEIRYDEFPAAPDFTLVVTRLIDQEPPAGAPGDPINPFRQSVLEPFRVLIAEDRRSAVFQDPWLGRAVPPAFSMVDHFDLGFFGRQPFMVVVTDWSLRVGLGSVPLDIAARFDSQATFERRLAGYVELDGDSFPFDDTSSGMVRVAGDFDPSPELPIPPLSLLIALESSNPITVALGSMHGVELGLAISMRITPDEITLAVVEPSLSLLFGAAGVSLAVRRRSLRNSG